MANRDPFSVPSESISKIMENIYFDPMINVPSKFAYKVFTFEC